jgi:hypothetical protein
MIEMVKYSEKHAIAGNETSIPPETMITISHRAKIIVISMDLDVPNKVSNEKNAELTNDITIESTNII